MKNVMLHSVDAEKLFTQILSLQDKGQNHNVDEPFSAYLPGETERCLVEQGGRCWEILVRILHVRRYARNRSHSRGRTRARSYLRQVQRGNLLQNRHQNERKL